MITFRQIKYFVTVCQTQKINVAASQLNVSASAISTSIKELQEVLGVKLLERHRRGVYPTPEGQRFFRHGITVMSTLNTALDDVSKGRVAVEGKLKLGLTVTIAGYFLSSPLSRFMRAFRGIDVEIAEFERPELERRLAQGDLDIGLMLVSNVGSEDVLTSERLVSSPRRLWVPAGHRLTSRSAVSLKDVEKEPYIQLAVDDAVGTTANYWAEHSLQPNIIFKTESVEAIRSLVATGRGVTILSDMLFRPWSLEAERIESLDVIENIPDMEIGLAWRKEKGLTKQANAFRNYCRSEVSLRNLNADMDEASLQRLF